MRHMRRVFLILRGIVRARGINDNIYGSVAPVANSCCRQTSRHARGTKRLFGYSLRQLCRRYARTRGENPERSARACAHGRNANRPELRMSDERDVMPLWLRLCRRLRLAWVLALGVMAALACMAALALKIAMHHLRYLRALIRLWLVGHSFAEIAEMDAEIEAQ
jgi:hypothetical protein